MNESDRYKFAAAVSECCHVPVAAIVDEARFEEDLMVDSLAVVELLMLLETEFNVEIADDDVEEIKTVGDAIRAIDDARLGVEAEGTVADPV